MPGQFEVHKSINIINHTSGLKDKNHVIVLIDEEKTLHKIQQAFMEKVLK